MSRTSPVMAQAAGQREVGMRDGRCQAAAKGTTSTGAPRRPRTQTSSGNSSNNNSQSGSWRA